MDLTSADNRVDYGHEAPVMFCTHQISPKARNLDRCPAHEGSVGRPSVRWTAAGGGPTRCKEGHRS